MKLTHLEVLTEVYYTLGILHPQIHWDHVWHVHINHKIDVLNVARFHSMEQLMLLTEMHEDFRLDVVLNMDLALQFLFLKINEHIRPTFLVLFL